MISTKPYIDMISTKPFKNTTSLTTKPSQNQYFMKKIFPELDFLNKQLYPIIIHILKYV